MVQPQRGANFTFPYEDDQLDVLNTITIVVASISLFASILVLIFYGLFMYYERKKADRVSLRCVALGSISNVIDIAFDLGSTIGETPQTVCRVIGLIVNFMDVLNAGFLAVIGINLFLVFVLKIDRTKRLERIYYPLIVFYGIMAMIGPIVKESQQFVPKNPTFDCWYYNHLGYRERHFVAWMCYYGFIFFIILLGLIGSLFSMIKLFREEAENIKIIRHITASTSILHSNKGGNSSNIKGQRYQHSNFPKVILRCITYTLVPLLVNIWGFSMQILILDTTSAPFGLAVVTTLMPSTEGLLTSMIFFSEPVITTHIKQKMAELYRIYGEEFSILEERTHRNRTTVRKHQEPQRRKSLQSGSTDRTHYTSNLFDKRNLVPRPPITENDHHNQQPHFVSHVDLGNDNRLKTLAPPLATMSPILSVGSVSTSPNSINPALSPQSLQRRGSSLSTSSPTVTSSTVTESIGSPSSFSDNGYDEDIISEIRTIPMRRVSVSSSVYSRIRYEYERRLSDDSATSTLVNHLGLGNNLIPSTDTQGQIFVPYRSPALARATHWLLVNIDRLRGRAPGHNNNRQQGQQGQPDISDNDMSIISTNSHSPVQNNPEVIVHSPSMPSNISTLSSRSRPRH